MIFSPCINKIHIIFDVHIKLQIQFLVFPISEICHETVNVILL